MPAAAATKCFRGSAPARDWIHSSHAAISINLTDSTEAAGANRGRGTTVHVFPLCRRYRSPCGLLVSHPHSPCSRVSGIEGSPALSEPRAKVQGHEIGGAPARLHPARPPVSDDWQLGTTRRGAGANTGLPLAMGIRAGDQSRARPRRGLSQGQKGMHSAREPPGGQMCSEEGPSQRGGWSRRAATAAAAGSAACSET